MALGQAFTSGVQAGSQAVARGQKLGISKRQTAVAEQEEQRKQQAATLDNFNAGLKKDLALAADIKKNADIKRANGEPVDPAAVNAAIDRIKGPNIMTSKMLNRAGAPVYPQIVAQQFETIKTGPSVQQEQKVKAQGEGLTAQARQAGQAAGGKEVASFQNFSTGEVQTIPLDDPAFDQKQESMFDNGFVRTKVPGVELSGTPEELGMTTKSAGSIEEDIINTDEMLSRLQEMENQFDPKFTEIGSKFVNRVALPVFEKFGGNLSEASEQELGEFTKFARQTSSNLNAYIKAVTGAQMSEPEAQRLKQDMPILGTGVFDGDSATQYKSKLTDVIKTLEASNERAKYLRANGLLGRGEKINEDMSAEYSLDKFRNIPAMPEGVDPEGWEMMEPEKKKRLVELINARKARE